MSCTHVGSVGIIRLKRNIYQNKAEKLQYSQLSLWRTLELVSSLVRVRYSESFFFSLTCAICFCRGFSFCSYLRCVRNLRVDFNSRNRTYETGFRLFL